ncbi:hypothetical protein P4V34_28715 [Bacillus thuringiensis]|nr:hypothetical protein [Bacillus thuringiensis]
MPKGSTKYQLLKDDFELKRRNEMIRDLRKEVDHWKKCTESEQKRAGRLQRKVERYESVLNTLLTKNDWLSTEEVEEYIRENLK